MILWVVLGGFGDSGFRYGRYCGLQTCRPVENDLLLLMRRTNVSWDVGDNSCLVDPCDLGRAKAKLLFRNVPCNSTVNELRSGESIRFKTHVLFLSWTDPDLVFTAQSRHLAARGSSPIPQYRCSYIQDTRTTCFGQIMQR